MKTAFIVTSAIEVGNDPLTYSETRSAFSTEERLRQTIMTIASVDQSSDSDSKIYLLDMSNDWINFKKLFGYQSNLIFVSIKDKFPNIFHEVTSHPNKSRCETLTTLHFLESYKEELDNYDVTVKLSGRYFLDSSFNLSVLKDDKIYFKRPREFAWQDWWGYNDVKLPDSENLRQYCSVIFAWGKQHNSKMRDLYQTMTNLLSQPTMQHYDMETLLYYHSRDYHKDIVETGWTVYGWLGATGKFLRE